MEERDATTLIVETGPLLNPALWQAFIQTLPGRFRTCYLRRKIFTGQAKNDDNFFYQVETRDNER